jgi:hypothetical protein
MNPPARRACALLCVPPALALVLAGLLSVRSDAREMSDVEKQIRRAARGPYLRLTLTDGRQVVGAYQGLIGDWSDSLASSVRYERWRSSSAPMLPRIGTPLTLVASGDTLRGNLWGFAPSAVLLGRADAASASSIPLATISAWLPGDSTVDTSWTTIRERVGSAPSVAGVALDQASRRVVVTREQIVMADGSSRDAAAGTDTGSTIVVALIAGAVGALIVCAVIANDVNNDLSNCTVAPSNKSDAAFGRAGLTPGSWEWRPGETRRP